MLVAGLKILQHIKSTVDYLKTNYWLNFLFPRRSGNVIFCQDQMELMREELPNARERFRKVNQMWKELSNEEKFQYKEKVNKKLKKYSKKLQKWLKV